MLITANPKAVELQAKLFRGFADPSRLAILEALRDGALTVSEIVQITGLTQSNVSNHLGCLRDCGLVTATPQGRFVYYELSDKRVG
ncbi:MAG: metalloregulator ArsR/SmtB family transcription factor, partial [Roseiflexaceae bacterium]|nr:metalloregulator ArsR/SmtB family transcription factor [Roseiflexaceae bacterium]